ncbi:hypothetical protein Tco_0103512 [Tanacetum coccineum]
MSTPKFAETRNLVAFLEKPKESNGFDGIIDFLKASSIKYALTVNPTVYESCIQQFWATAKAKTVNWECRIQALVDKKKMIITEKSVRSDLMLEDAEGIECLPNDVIFEQLTLMGKQRKDSGPTEPIPDKTTMKNLYLPLPVIHLKVRKKSRTSGLKRLSKVSSASRVESSNDVSLGAQEDASKQGRKIANIDADAEVTLIDETQERNDEEMLFDVQDDLQGEEVVAEKEVAEKEVSAADPVTTAGEVVTTANVEVTTASAPTTTIDELTLAQTLIEIKAAKPKAVTSAATTTTTTRPKARGVVVQEPSEFKTTSSPLQASQLPQAKDKGKAKMVEPKKPLKKKDQIAIDEEVARNLEAQLQAELEEEERLSRLKEEEANIALLESWDNTQAMMDADFQLAQQMQTEEQEQLSIEEKSKLFVELLEKRKKHFAALRAQEKRSKPPTKAQKRNTMSTYLKNMAGYKHNQLKSKSYDEIQEIFDKEMKRVNTFVDMNTKLVKGSKTKVEGSSKRAGDELEQEKAKKQKGNDDQEEEKMKKHMEIVQDDEVAIDAIPLATKPPVIVEWKIIKEGKMGYFQLIRADGSSKRPEEAYERVLWGDLKVMFEPDIESEVWRSLEGHNVTVYKLFSSSGVHFVRFKHLHIFMLVEKKYPLTPAIITGMLNKKLQTDQWNEMCYQLLKLMTKQQKNPGSV